MLSPRFVPHFLRLMLGKKKKFPPPFFFDFLFRFLFRHKFLKLGENYMFIQVLMSQAELQQTFLLWK